MSEEKSVALVTPTYKPETAGSTVYFNQVAEILKQSDKYTPYIFTEYVEGMKVVEKIDDIPVIRLCTDRGDVIKKHNTPVQFVEGMFEDEIDIYHIHTHTSGLSSLYRSIAGYEAPFIYDFRDPGSVPKSVFYGQDKYYFSINERIDSIIRREYNANEDRIYRSPVSVTVDDVGESESFDTDKFRCVFVGSLHHHKGMGIAIESVLSSEIDDIELLIFGSGPEQERMEEISSTYPNIHYMGEVEHETSLAEIKKADVVIAPYDTEGEPRVITEAVKLDTPVISTDAGNISEIVGIAGIIVDRHPVSFESALVNMYNYQDEFNKLAQDNDYTTYDEQQMREMLLSAYNNISASYYG